MRGADRLERRQEGSKVAPELISPVGRLLHRSNNWVQIRCNSRSTLRAAAGAEPPRYHSADNNGHRRSAIVGAIRRDGSSLSEVRRGSGAAAGYAPVYFGCPGVVRGSERRARDCRKPVRCPLIEPCQERQAHRAGGARRGDEVEAAPTTAHGRRTGRPMPPFASPAFVASADRAVQKPNATQSKPNQYS
jgi:hypothetical protein